MCKLWRPMIRRRILRRLICVGTVCQLLFCGYPDKNRLIYWLYILIVLSPRFWYIFPWNLMRCAVFPIILHVYQQRLRSACAKLEEENNFSSHRLRCTQKKIMYYTIRYTKSVRKDKWLVLSTCKRNILGSNRARVKKNFWPLVQVVQHKSVWSDSWQLA